MKTIQSYSEYSENKQTILTVGTFDGVHLGHQMILKKLTSEAKKGNYNSMLLTFFPHPRFVVNTNTNFSLLSTMDEKKDLLEAINLDYLVVQKFTEEFSNYLPADYVKKILVDGLNVKKIIIGYDHKFSKNRSAGIEELINFGKEFNFEVEQISAQEIKNNTISSTKIRTALKDGNIKLANEYLGHTFSFSGIVVKGNQLGRTIKFPTANIVIKETYKLLPKNGVYIVNALVGNKSYKGMMNIGLKPTVGGLTQTIEVHILDFSCDIYSQMIKIDVLDFIREETKFSSIEELKIQLEKDKIIAQKHKI